MNEEGADRTTCIIRMAVLIVGCVAAVAAIVAVTIYARRALKGALMVRACVGPLAPPVLHAFCISLSRIGSVSTAAAPSTLGRQSIRNLTAFSDGKSSSAPEKDGACQHPDPQPSVLPVC